MYRCVWVKPILIVSIDLQYDRQVLGNFFENILKNTRSFIKVIISIMKKNYGIGKKCSKYQGICLKIFLISLKWHFDHFKCRENDSNCEKI